MNVYIFRNPDMLREFHAWLESEVRGRYHFTRLTPRVNWPFEPVRTYDEQRRDRFHSQTTMDHDHRWANSQFSRRSFHYRAERTRHYRWNQFHQHYKFKTSYDMREVMLDNDPLTVFFDSASDMVLAKLTWHDYNERC